MHILRFLIPALVLAACQPLSPPVPPDATLELSRGSAFSGRSLWCLTSDDRLEIEITTPHRPGKPTATKRSTSQSAPGTFARAEAYLRAHQLPQGRLKARHHCMDYGSDSIRMTGTARDILQESHCPNAALDALDKALRCLIRP